MHRFRRVLPVLLLLVLLQIGFPAQAQDNLLKNANFENPYGGIGTADGWDGGFVASPRTEVWMNADTIFTAHRGDKTYEGTSTQQMGRGGSTFTAAVWQKVDNIQAGTRLRFSVWVYVENEAGSNARARIGIDSNNTASPLDDMAWSPYMTTYGAWQEMSVEATVPAGYVTVYIFGTQDWPKLNNSVYMDQASLRVVGTGQVVAPPTAAAGGTAAPVIPVVPTTRPQVYAPSVSRQDEDTSDGIIHTVQSGDTLAAIAVAYRTTVTNILELNGLERGAMLALGQKIIIEKPGASAPASENTSPTTAPVESTVISQSRAEPTTASAATTPGNPLAAILGQKTDVPPTQEAQAEEPTEAAPSATLAPENTAVPTDLPAPTATEMVALPTSTVEGTSVADAVTSLEAGVCVTLFNDANQDRNQGEGEAVLPGGLIALQDLQGKEVASHMTTADTAPFCFIDVAPTTYNLITTPPTGYGLTTTSALTVNVQVGVKFQVSIGAAQGVTPLATPTLDTAVIQSVPDADVAAPSSGALVLLFVGLIAVVAIGAGILLYVIRRL